LTTIACNREEMYGDLQYTIASGKFKGRPKVQKFKANDHTYHEDFLMGFTGSAADMIPVISYFLRPDLYDKPPKSRVTGLVLTASGNIFVFDDYTKWLGVDQDYYAMGSGAPFALGALQSGASPKEAVKVAMKHDIYTGMGVKGYKI
jgi:ATP-dependent protease HslVU (ClpYQ) peptidase subunit